jgi:hypothetical protein
VIAGALAFSGRRAASPTARKAKVQLPWLVLTERAGPASNGINGRGPAALADGKDAVYAGCDLDASSLSVPLVGVI